MNIMRALRLKPQTKKVLRHLDQHGYITPLHADYVYGVRSLSSRISELKKAGYRIIKQMCKDDCGQRFARYTLIGDY